MPHAMYGLEEIGLAGEVVLHFRLHVRHVGRVNESVPIKQYVIVIEVVPEHCLPASRQVDALGIAVEVPDTVIRCGINELVALVHFIQDITILGPFEANGQRCADQFEQ